MSQHLNQRWAWLGLAVAFVIVTVSIKVSTQEAPSSRKSSVNDMGDEIEQQMLPSQAIPISALRTLIDSPVPAISSAATALANKRLGDQKTYRALLACVHHDLDSSDENLQYKARLALSYLEEHISMSYMPPSEPSIASTTSPADDMQPSIREQLRSLQEDQHTGPRQARLRPAHAPADRDRRRRRREAMLFHEGSGELSEGDIIELNAALAEIINATPDMQRA